MNKYNQIAVDNKKNTGTKQKYFLVIHSLIVCITGWTENTTFYSQCYPWNRGHRQHPEVLGVHVVQGNQELRQFQQHPAGGGSKQQKQGHIMQDCQTLFLSKNGI